MIRKPGKPAKYGVLVVNGLPSAGKYVGAKRTSSMNEKCVVV